MSLNDHAQKTDDEILAERLERERERRAKARELPLVELLLDLAARVTWPSEPVRDEWYRRAEDVLAEIQGDVRTGRKQLDQLTRWLEREEAQADEQTETETGGGDDQADEQPPAPAPAKATGRRPGRPRGSARPAGAK